LNNPLRSKLFIFSLTISLILLLGGVIFEFSLPTAFAPGQDISSPEPAFSGINEKDMAQAGSNVYVVFRGTDNEVYGTASTDSGATFGTPINLSNSIAPSGTPSVAYQVSRIIGGEL